ncbi:MAG: hypothetical protein ACO1G9_09825 [Bacteroidota bacterium]
MERIMKVRDIQPPEVLKSIRFMTFQPDPFNPNRVPKMFGNLGFIRLYEKDYKYWETNDELDTGILQGLKTVFLNATYEYSNLALFDLPYERQVRSIKNGVMLPFNLSFMKRFDPFQISGTNMSQISHFNISTHIYMYCDPKDSRLEFIPDYACIELEDDLYKKVYQLKLIQPLE